MKNLALYRKYRPSNFEEIYGQKFIVNIMKNSLKKNKISHAYLFSGPRGTGKTSMAKLFAKIVNCSNLTKDVSPCGKCNSCELIDKKTNPDIIEIDAASNNGVDEIRELRDKVSLMPAVSKYKVYIIDEVHMLTISAFNALLKTLEEPPEHIIFILATTELYKVPETIVSRCQCLEFERISDDDIVSCLKNIVEKEKIKIDDQVLKMIANYSKGGLRDSIGILDKLSSCSDSIDVNLFYDVVGVVSDENVNKIIELITKKDIVNLFNILDSLSSEGKNIPYLIEQIMNMLKNRIVNESDYSDSDLIILEGLNDILVNIKQSFNYLLSFETGLLEIVNKLEDDNKIISREIIEVKEEKNDDSVLEEKKEKIVEVNENVSKIKETKQMFDEIGINNAFALADKQLKQKMLSEWKNFNDYVHNKEFSSIVSYFLDSSLEVAGEKDVIIGVENIALVNNANFNKAKLELLFNLVIGNFYNLVFVTYDYFEELKEKYISDIKSGKKYEYITVQQEKSDIIEDEKVEESPAFESAKSVFGSDIVEMK